MLKFLRLGREEVSREDAARSQSARRHAAYVIHRYLEEKDDNQILIASFVPLIQDREYFGDIYRATSGFLGTSQEAAAHIVEKYKKPESQVCRDMLRVWELEDNYGNNVVATALIY